jgi:hypothetical protein
VKLTIAALPAAIGIVELKIRDPGTIRHVAFEMRQKLIMENGRPDFEEVPVLFVEAQDSATIRTRRYAIIHHGQWIEPDEDESAAWVATGLSGRGLLVHVFELTRQVP